MNTFASRVFLLLLGSCVTPALSGAAEAEKAPVFFDGKTFDGWMMLDGKPVRGGWEVVDGTIHLSRKEGRSGHIITRHEFGDFDLRFEFKIAARGNSGLKYRVRRFGNKILGCEYQIFDDAGRNVHPQNSCGSLYDVYEPNDRKELKPAGESNSARIRVEGRRLEHWLNGKLIVLAEVGSPEWQRRVAGSKFSDAEGFGENRRGRIMLTDHGSEVWYSNLQFQPLNSQQGKSPSKPGGGG